MRKRGIGVALVAAMGAFMGLAGAGPAGAGAPTGAIFTTLPDGSAVNFNIYAQKTDVYLDGGPGPGAPATAAGLDDGTYVFQVTDPSGKNLLSEDAARCRQFNVVGGLIVSLVVTGCEHVVGVDLDHGATTVQLMPYADTPNPGGEYKAWATRVEDFVKGCAALGQAAGLNVVDCGGRGGNRHGFVNSDSKTDNFKVGHKLPVEIDTRFTGSDGNYIDGLKATWTDTLGAGNVKWSQWDPDHVVFHEAHVEAVEAGTHYITVADQPGCTVGDVYLAGSRLRNRGGQTIPVSIKNTNKELTVFIDVKCS